MRNKKLISMTDFVLDEFEKLENVPTQITAIEHINKIKSYATFLKIPLELGMFVGENPIFVFENIFTEWDESDVENSTIEDLLTDDLTYYLTESAIKQLGL